MLFSKVLSRTDYWMRMAIVTLSEIGGFFLVMFISNVIPSLGFSAMMLYGVLNIVILVVTPFWSLYRLHDVGLNGLFMFLNFFPGFGSLMMFVILLLPRNTFDYWRPART